AANEGVRRPAARRRRARPAGRSGLPRHPERALDRDSAARWRRRGRGCARQRTPGADRCPAAAGSRDLQPQDRTGGRPMTPSPTDVIRRAAELREALGGTFRDEAVRALYAEAGEVARRAVRTQGARLDLDQRIDRIVTSPVFGLPLMALLLAVVFWITVAGANVPSNLLARALFAIEGAAVQLFDQLGAPWWLTGFLWNGVYRGLAWVVSVMLPPMAIFFPLFTMLEDLGYLPRVAFNLDFLFRRAGAHGKQALTMAMGFGCNAAGVIATRVIDSPRERLIAILTNNFVPCNGRYPTLIMLATIFVGASMSPLFASIAAAAAVVGIVVIGVITTLVVSRLLSGTVLAGEASAFSLELPPYRRPAILRILYTSPIDRTLFVPGRARRRPSASNCRHTDGPPSCEFSTRR